MEGLKMADLDTLLESIAVNMASRQSTPSDLGLLATALKDIAETKASLAEQTSHRTYRLEYLKSLSAFLVPLVSLLALPVTLVVGGYQIRASQQQAQVTLQSAQQQAAAALKSAQEQAEDSQWRDLLASISRAKDAINSDVTIAPRLKSFAGSLRYGSTAKDIAARLIGSVVDNSSFSELFDYVFPEVTEDNLETAVAVARKLTRLKKAIESKCYDMRIAAGVTYCGADLDDVTFDKKVKVLRNPARAATLDTISAQRQVLVDIGNDSIFYSKKLEGPLRLRLSGSGGKHAKGIDLSAVFLNSINLSNLDFSSSNISGAIFDTVDIAKSDLQVGASDGADFRASNWWDAKAINPDLLLSLIQRNNPIYAEGISLSIVVNGAGAGKDQYRQKVESLCSLAHTTCPKPIPYGNVP
jgi:uncharacterized protein YjbI with pentapeptide repeats